MMMTFHVTCDGQRLVKMCTSLSLYAKSYDLLVDVQKREGDIEYFDFESVKPRRSPFRQLLSRLRMRRPAS